MRLMCQESSPEAGSGGPPDKGPVSPVRGIHPYGRRTIIDAVQHSAFPALMRFVMRGVGDVSNALAQHVFVDIAQRGDLRSRHAREPFDVIGAAASDSADGYAHAIIGAQDFAAERERCRACGDCFARGLQKLTPLDSHRRRLCVG